MNRQTVTIDQLHLRIPGLSADEARLLAADITQRIGEMLPPDGRHERLGALDVHITLPAGTPRDRMAGPIARAILERL
jgi:hypothetical protein